MPNKASFVESLDERQAEYLLAHFIFAHDSPGKYPKLAALWEYFLQLQNAGREMFAAFDWVKADGETLVYALNEGIIFSAKLEKLFPQSFSNRFIHEDLQQLFIWHLILEGLRINPDDPLEYATLALVEYQLGFFAYAELARREVKKGLPLKNDFWAMSFVQFSNSTDRDIDGAEIMRNQAIQQISRSVWRKLPKYIQARLQSGLTSKVERTLPLNAAANILTETWDTMVKDFGTMDPKTALVKYIDGKLKYAALAGYRDILDHLEKEKSVLARKELVDLENSTLLEIDTSKVKNDSGEPQEADNDEEQFKITIVEENQLDGGSVDRGLDRKIPRNVDLEKYDAHFDQFPDDEQPLLAYLKINGRNLVKLAARTGKSPQRWGQSHVKPQSE